MKLSDHRSLSKRTRRNGAHGAAADAPVVCGGSNSTKVKRRALGGLARLICALMRSEAPPNLQTPRAPQCDARLADRLSLAHQGITRRYVLPAAVPAMIDNT
jgi:hypothetical protein